MQDHIHQRMNVIDLKFLRVGVTDSFLSKLITVEITFYAASYVMKDHKW
jgi:hypothetical protein